MTLEPMTVAVQLNIRLRTRTKNLPTLLYPVMSCVTAPPGDAVGPPVLETVVDAVGTTLVPLAPAVGPVALAQPVSSAASMTAARIFMSVGQARGGNAA